MFLQRPKAKAAGKAAARVSRNNSSEEEVVEEIVEEGDEIAVVRTVTLNGRSVLFKFDESPKL